MDILVIGAGLAGSEAAWYLANRGHCVRLQEMRPQVQTPAHQSGLAAELVCSNSFKSEEPQSATGILKSEMQTIGSLVLQAAHATRVPAGNSLAVDREAFSSWITKRLEGHPGITLEKRLVTDLSLDAPCLLATGPLTHPSLATWLEELCGQESLHFYDAIAPIVHRDSINMEHAWLGSRYDKGDPDFINCPMDHDQYQHFVQALLSAERVPLHDFECRFFEACLPLEVMAERGPETLRFGPLKPVGLRHPITSQRPWAVLQLRQDSLAGDHFNLVGCQTRLKWSAQKEVFRLIPALHKAEFLRLGSIHRNTYLCAPRLFEPTMRLRSQPLLWMAGQLTGVEGYLESAASGILAAHALDRHLRDLPAAPFPRETIMGSLAHYLAHSKPEHFSPMNAMIGLLPDLPDWERPKKTTRRDLRSLRNEIHRARSASALKEFLSSN